MLTYWSLPKGYCMFSILGATNACAFYLRDGNLARIGTGYFSVIDDF